MQRLFSTFPESWPGLGLLILRVSTALTAIDVHYGWLPDGRLETIIANIVSVLGGLFLIIGFCVPYAAAAIVILLSIKMFMAHVTQPEDLLLVTIGVCLIMIGPGAWSVDALLFGRRRIDIRPR